MSFFAGVFSISGELRDHPESPAARSAFRLNAGASQWHRPDHGLLAHLQSIVTPQDRYERLPLVFADGRKVLTLDGRLDNRNDLIRALGLRDPDGRLCDSLVLAAALERWGDDACRRLIGDFAFACWDIGCRRLLLVCDQTCGRVLYYHVSSNRIVFATAIDAVLHFPKVSRDLDMRSLGQLLLDHPPELGNTVYRDVRQLPSAGRLVWSAGQVAVGRYWTPDLHREIRYSRDEDYVDAARELLDQAVACRMRVIGPVVCQMSGGFDSGAVAATAARVARPACIQTITAMPQIGAPLPARSGSAFVDEWAYAKSVAAMYPNVQAHTAPARPPIPEDATVLFHTRGRPVRNFMNVSWFSRADEKVRQLGARMVLTGLSGNLTLSWKGTRRLADLARAFRFSKLTNELLEFWRQGRDLRSLLRAEVIAPMNPLPIRSWAKTVLGRSTLRVMNRSAISQPFAEAIYGTELADASIGRVQGLTYDASMRLEYLERMWRRRAESSMRSYLGFERRDPLGDIRLIDFCVAIPSDQFLRNGVQRLLARRVLTDRLPQNMLLEQRIGRQCPEWFHRLTGSREQLLATLERLHRSPIASYVLDLQRMKSIAAHWPADADAAENDYGQLLSVLARGVNIGEFIEWVEGGSVAPSHTNAECDIASPRH